MPLMFDYYSTYWFICKALIFVYALNKILQCAHLRFTEKESTAKRERAQVRPGDWSLVKRVGG